ncbi:response regulator [Ilyobacter sp.]|uniref:response regulator n=1 Tax=Ilyobacter sp. TaxID=3100343 RepID=UPI00356B3602
MGKKRILVIDDEESIRFLLREVIEDLGYHCLEAESAISGIEIVDSEKPDLIILDIQMPQMNGLEAIQKIRKINKKVPIFMLSAFSHMENVIENRGVDVQEFIPKPFDIDYLSKRITEEMD